MPQQTPPPFPPACTARLNVAAAVREVSLLLQASLSRGLPRPAPLQVGANDPGPARPAAPPLARRSGALLPRSAEPGGAERGVLRRRRGRCALRSTRRAAGADRGEPSARTGRPEAPQPEGRTWAVLGRLVRRHHLGPGGRRGGCVTAGGVVAGSRWSRCGLVAFPSSFWTTWATGQTLQQFTADRSAAAAVGPVPGQYAPVRLRATPRQRLGLRGDGGGRWWRGWGWEGEGRQG